MSGTLYVIATPIGNLEDITHRALRVLGEIDALACEDTRRTRIIYEKYGIHSPRIIFSYREQNEEKAGARILELLGGGMTVGICSDAGYPGVSDPGYRLIRRAVESQFPVTVIPGAGAVAVALLSSGLPTSSYTYKGFPPRKQGQRKRFLDADRDSPHTLVFFESPFRLGAFLADARDVLGNRRGAVCIELTKQFEDVRRGNLTELAEAFAVGKPRGEITVVIAGNNPKFLADEGNDSNGDASQ